MPEILGYTNISTSEFIKRVESRSSLLIMSGHKRLESGLLVQVYEFLHLSFQEYLTAKAIVKKFLPLFEANKNVLDILKPNVNRENWKEVFPLVAVLLERNSKELIDYLISESKAVAEKTSKAEKAENKLPPTLLGNCLANEIQINPEILGNAIEWYTKNHYNVFDKGANEIILNNKFGQTFRDRTKKEFYEKFDDRYISPLGGALSDIFLRDLNTNDPQEILRQILIKLSSESDTEKCTATLGFMSLCFSFHEKDTEQLTKNPEMLSNIFNALKSLSEKNNSHLKFSIYWCIVWAEKAGLFPSDLKQFFSEQLSKLLVNITEYNFRRTISWALYCILTPTISKEKIMKIRGIKTCVEQAYHNPSNEFDRFTAIYLGYILGTTQDKNEIYKIFEQKAKGREGDVQPNMLQFYVAYGFKIKELEELRQLQMRF